jgi:uncharacterized protein YdeI (BOF family)
MQTMKKIIPILLMAVMTLPALASAENKETKNIKETTEATVLMGTVVEQSTGEALPGAQVTINGKETVYTDLDGNFEVRDIKAGTYNLEISLISYEQNKIQNLVISSNKKSALKVELKR